METKSKRTYPPIDGLWLNRGEEKLLKKLYRKRRITKDKAAKCLRFEKDTSAMASLQFKDLIISEGDFLRMIKRGDNWIELHRKKLAEKMFPHIVSVIAIIISIIALFKS